MTRKNYSKQPSIEKEDSATTPQEEARALDKDRLQTVEEVAQFIRFSAKSIYQLVHRGRIPYIKISGALRFKTSDLEIWLEENTFRPQVNDKGSQSHSAEDKEELENVNGRGENGCGLPREISGSLTGQDGKMVCHVFELYKVRKGGEKNGTL